MHAEEPIPDDARCPHCRAFALDEDGYRAAYCANCGRCDHPHTTDRGGRVVCAACGAVVDKVAVADDDGEAD